MVAANNAELFEDLMEAMVALQVEMDVLVSAIFGEKLMHLILSGLSRNEGLPS